MLFAVTSLSPNAPPSSSSSSSSSDDDDENDDEENKGKKKTKLTFIKKKKSIPSYQSYKSDATSAVFGRFIVDYDDE